MTDITPEKVAATPPTPKNVAEMLTSSDNVYHDGNYWHPSIGAQGNVVHIGITAYSEDGEKLPEVHFRAVVVEAPAYTVAGEPVELSGDLARTLAYEDVGYARDGWTVVANDFLESQRWESLHELVIRNDAGQHFADTYRKGLTESQGTGAYEYEDKATFRPVVPRFKVVTTWGAAQAEQNGGTADV